ncbi:tetratricopeptide repeat protein [uncultured Lutibacter sp.]|uniref:tetratricopeptide repeat protein n=1 Tax=uncultured Lutibacter sp. TaxID=437739 RepID=UPI00262B7C8A|nr:tetratricopeptide repeat protein [uncultured Lutibacter sp.]
MNLNFVFNSADHLRYENGRHVSGPHGGAPRAVKVEPNITGNVGYTVTMFNTDGQYVVQMAPKQMKIIQQTTDKIILRGYGYDNFGSSFADYGLSIYYKNGIVEKCILHMHDRNIDIEYLKSDSQTIEKESSKISGIEEIKIFLNKFIPQPRHIKLDLAGETDNLNNIGVDYYESGDINSAILYYNKALEIYPINDDALKNLIVCYRETGNLEKMYEAQEKLEYLKKIGL